MHYIADELKIEVPQYVNDDFRTMISAFGHMLICVRTSIIRSKKVSLEDLRDFLKDHYCYGYLGPQLEHATSLRNALILIEKECKLFDVEPLRDVIDYFQIMEAEDYIAKYEKKIDEFCSNLSVCLCLKQKFEAFESHHLRCEIAVFTFDWDPDIKISLKDIKRILSKASGRQVKIIGFDTIHSISITCTFPHTLLGDVISELLENLDMLKAKGLMELIVGYTTIWKRGKVGGSYNILCIYIIYIYRRWRFRQT